MPHDPVLTKNDFARRYALGEFGNRSPTWNNFGEFAVGSGGMTGLVHLRNRVRNGPTWYDVPIDEVAAKFKEVVLAGLVKQDDIYFSLMCPTEKTLFQGEVFQSERHLSLFYTTVAKPMREALKEESFQVYGLEAVLPLRHYLCPNSIEWLRHLLDEYPDHVIEFTALSTKWGTLSNFNTLFWEVRLY